LSKGLRGHLQGAFSGLLKGTAGLFGGGSLLGLASPLGAAGLAVGAFAALAVPALSKVHKALSTTGKAGQKAWAALDPGQRHIAKSLQSLKAGFSKLSTAFEPILASVIQLGAKVVTDLEPALKALAPAGARIITAFLRPLDALLKSPFFKRFIDQMSQLAMQVAPILGKSLVGLLKVFMQLFMQAGPSGVKLLGQLLPLFVSLLGDLVPVITVITKITAGVIGWLKANHLLVPALIAVGAAMTIAGGPFSVVVTGIALVVAGLVHMWKTSQTFRNVVTTVFSAVGRIVIALATQWLRNMKMMTDAVLALVSTQVHLLAMIPGPWQGAMKKAAAAVDGFKTSADTFFNGAISKLGQWNTNLKNAPKVVKLQGNITDLQSKLATAKRQLKDPNLTKTRRATILANIAQLQRQIASAKAQLNALNGKTVSTYITTYRTTAGSFISGGRGGHLLAAGGLIRGMAGGGFSGFVRGPGGPTADKAGLFALSNGEYVMRAAAVARYGKGALDAMNAGNAPGAAAGGLAGRAGHGGAPVNVVLSAAPGDPLMAAFVRALRYEVASNGGGDVQAHLGRS